MTIPGGWRESNKEAYVSNDIRHYADEMLRHIEESCRFVFTAPTPIHPKKIKKLRP